jgi:hypothetical protein
MTNYQVEERAKLKKQWVDQAIALAMQNKWDEAITANQRILEQLPNDVDALNRLGRALTELGRYAEAREAYQRAVSIDKLNVIAKRNLTRLASMGAEAAPAKVGQRVDARFFIEETGKTGITPITRTTGRKTLATLTTGDQVNLEAQGRALFVRGAGGETIGQVEPKLAQRLIDLMNGGNRYAAAVMSVDEDSVRILIRETYQVPSQTGKVSFPTRGEAAGVRPYIKGTLIRYESEEEEEEEEGEIEAELDAEEAEEPGEVVELEEEHSPE